MIENNNPPAKICTPGFLAITILGCFWRRGNCVFVLIFYVVENLMWISVLNFFLFSSPAIILVKFLWSLGKPYRIIPYVPIFANLR